jgi:hypothetical protein
MGFSQTKTSKRSKRKRLTVFNKKVPPRNRGLTHRRYNMEFYNYIKRNNYINAPINFGHGINLSVQASAEHECSPKENIEDITEYETFEVLLYLQINSDARLETLSLPSFTGLEDPPLDESSEHNWACLNVPAEQVEEIFQILKQKFGLKRS